MAARLCLVCVLALTVPLAQHQQETPSFRLEQGSREENRVALTCQSSGEHGDFILNSTRIVNEDDVIERNDNTVVIEIKPSNEGTYSCGILGGVNSIQSRSAGPFATHPRFTQHLHIRLYYVGEVGGEVTFLKFVPLGAMSGLYTFTWLNSSGQAQQGPRHSLNANASLSIRGLQHSDGGHYGLRVTVNDSTGTHTFTNSSYQLFVQEKPTILTSSEDKVTVHRGTDIQETFFCTVQGYPNLAISWLHAGRQIANSSKYTVSSIPTRKALTSELTSTLTIKNLDSADNGVLTCMACVDGCSTSLSHTDCYPQVFNTSSEMALSVLSADFQYEVVILRGKNMELRIALTGSPIPAPVKVFLQYQEERTNTVTPALSPSTYTNISDIWTVYIPNAFTPNFTRFKIKIALGIDQSHMGPYVPPTHDIVYDLNDLFDACERWKLYIAIFLSVVVAIAVIVIVSIVGIFVLIFQKRSSNINQKRRAEKIAEKMIDSQATPEERMEQFEKLFPRCCRTLKRGGCDLDGSDSGSEADSSAMELAPVTISKEWLEATDGILNLIRNRKEKRVIIGQLTRMITKEKWQITCKHTAV